MSELQKPAVDPKVIETSGASSDEVGYSSIQEGALKKVTRTSAILTVLVSGLALFSDGYNAQIIGYMKPLFSDLYKKDVYTDTISTRLSNSCTSLTISLQQAAVSQSGANCRTRADLIGEIFGMLFFGYIIDKIGRRTGIVFATLFLVLGIVLATAAHGEVFSEYSAATSDPI